MSSKYPWTTISYRSRRLSVDESDARVEDRQDRLPGLSTAALAEARLLLVRGGGLGSHVACGLARKGAGVIAIADCDTVEASKLNRQAFRFGDIGRPKALCLAGRAARVGFLGSLCIGHDVAFREDTAAALLNGMTICICGVDNNETRRAASVACRERAIPCVHMAVNQDADFGWIFVEEDGACVACAFPRMAEPNPGRQPCQPVPAVLDMLLILAGLTLRTIDTLLMPRARYWNYRDVHLATGATESIVPRKPTCGLCGGG